METYSQEDQDNARLGTLPIADTDVEVRLYTSEDRSHAREEFMTQSERIMLAKTMDAGSEDPSDPEQTTRVGTLLFPEEY